MVLVESLTLPTEYREAGWALADLLLTKHEMHIVGLFWAEYDEADWRLFLVSPRAYEANSQEFENELEVLISGLQIAHSDLNRRENAHPLWDHLLVANPTNPAVRRVYQAYGEVPMDSKMVRRFVLGPGDAYIYFLNSLDSFR
jgi:hypothetical protein